MDKRQIEYQKGLPRTTGASSETARDHNEQPRKLQKKGIVECGGFVPVTIGILKNW
jgi:hypothetical protein